jgi:hypothetical protein
MNQGQIIKEIGVALDTYVRWREEYGGMRVDQADETKVYFKKVGLHRTAITHQNTVLLVRGKISLPLKVTPLASADPIFGQIERYQVFKQVLFTLFAWKY